MENAKKLSLAHLESASLLLPKIDEEGGVARVVALYLASAHEAVEFRVNPSVLDPYIHQANELDADESMEIIQYFFGRWQTFQNSILTSAGVPTEILERVKTERLMALAGHPASSSPA